MLVQTNYKRLLKFSSLLAYVLFSVLYNYYASSIHLNTLETRIENIKYLVLNLQGEYTYVDIDKPLLLIKNLYLHCYFRLSTLQENLSLYLSNATGTISQKPHDTNKH